MVVVNLFFVVGCLSILAHGYKIFVGKGDTNCVDYPGTAVVQPGSGCKQFLLCNAGGLAFGPLDCAHGTLFDEANQTCLRTKDVTCLDSVDVSLPDCVTAAVPGDCQEYTQCVMGIQWYRECGNSTVYSNSLHVCVHDVDLSNEERQDCGL